MGNLTFSPLLVCEFLTVFTDHTAVYTGDGKSDRETSRVYGRWGQKCENCVSSRPRKLKCRCPLFPTPAVGIAEDVSRIDVSEGVHQVNSTTPSEVQSLLSAGRQIKRNRCLNTWQPLECPVQNHRRSPTTWASRLQHMSATILSPTNESRILS